MVTRSKGNLWLGKAVPCFAGLCLLLGVLLFSGCNSDSNDAKDSLIGVWSSSSGDGYTISNNQVIYTGYKDNDHPNWSDYSFTGEIKNNPDFTKDSGVIIIKYTKKPIYGTYNDDWTQLTGGAPPNGDFFGIYWRELTSSSVMLANAYDAALTETEQDTLSKAQAKFTTVAASNLVNWSNVKPQTKK